MSPKVYDHEFNITLQFSSCFVVAVVMLLVGMVKYHYNVTMMPNIQTGYKFVQSDAHEGRSQDSVNWGTELGAVTRL